MKKYLIFILLAMNLSSYSQDKNSVDTIAVRILDRMSELIGGMESVSFTADISHDVEGNKFGMVKEFSTTEVYMVGPDKMHVQSNGTSGHRGYWYNGETLVYYSFKENNYSVVDAPSDIITMMDSINQTFDIEFPAADIFYPGLVNTILENFENIDYLGEKMINGVNCFHILATSETTNLQFWISDDAFFLPERFVITHLDDRHKQYEVNFTNWGINPILPEEMFTFEPPPKAKNIAIMATKAF